MLNNFSRLQGSSVTASDGQLGHVESALFDDATWVIRYLVVDIGSWLTGREVLISPYLVGQPLSRENNVNVHLTRQQVKDSPDIDTHKPVSRQHELDYMRYYGFPTYWGGSGMWGDALFPVQAVPLVVGGSAAVAAGDGVVAEDTHLRSSRVVMGYDIRATDDSIGHVADFIFDDESWAIRYLVVDVSSWWQRDKKVLIATHWIDRIEWSTSKVHLSMTREQVRQCPDYDEALPIARDYELRLHAAYHRRGYWEKIVTPVE